MANVPLSINKEWITGSHKVGCLKKENLFSPRAKHLANSERDAICFLWENVLSSMNNLSRLLPNPITLLLKQKDKTPLNHSKTSFRAYVLTF